MKKSDEYIAKIESYKPKDLILLWNQIKNNTVENFWAQGKAFEYLILKAFKIENADVMWPLSVWEDGKEIEQIDGAVYCKGLSSIIECKDSNDEINFEPIAKIRSQLLRRPSSAIANVFSRSGYTDNALILAQYNSPQTILLWQQNEIEYALKKKKFTEGLEIKYRNFVQKGIQDINIEFYKK